MVSGLSELRGSSGEALEEGYWRLRKNAGLVEFTGRGILRLTGPDAADFLQGLVTSDVASLAVGSGRPAAVLTPLGKVFAILYVFRTAPDGMLLLLQGESRPVSELLERYHFGEQVDRVDLTGATAWLSLQGPEAPAATRAAAGSGGILEPSTVRSARIAGHEVVVARMDEIGLPGVHVLVPSPVAPEVRAEMASAAAARGGGPAPLEAWSVVRVEAGVPWQGSELDETALPMEAGLTELIDLTKGCFVGQEVVSRALVQGRTNWSLWGLRLPQTADIHPGEELRIGDRPRPVIRVRSMVRSPAAAGPVALAYVHREVARPGPVVVRGERTELEVTLEPLPFAFEGTAAEP